MIGGANLNGPCCVWADYTQANGPADGTHYKFMTTSEVDYLIDQGMNGFRLLFAWEAVQDKPWRVPGSNTIANYKSYWNQFSTLLNHITVVRNKVCVVDIHGGRDSTFAAYRDIKCGGKLPTGESVTDMFENLWWNLATMYKNNPNVQIGVTNEPIGITAAEWFKIGQRIVTKVRSVGFTGWIWMPGIAFTGAGSWVSSGNAAAWNIVDPLNRTGVQVHMYFDKNSSGGNGMLDIVDVNIGVTRLKATVDWCRSKGLKCILGEVGLSATNPIAQQTIDNLAAYTRANDDILDAWYWWSAGPAVSSGWWAQYQFLVADTPLGRAQLNLLKNWLKPPVVVDPCANVKAELATMTARATDAEARALDLAAKAADLKNQVGNLLAENATLADLGAKYSSMIAKARAALE